MINIEREPECPSSLETEAIQDYLSRVAAHATDPENNEKPMRSPAYRNCDLLDAFDRCFFSKCYLTEEKFINSYSMDVEHFHGRAGDLLYDWNNLYPASHYANMRKPRNTPVGGYLDPCNLNEDVEKEIFYSLSAQGEKPDFGAVSSKNIKAVNTADLLDKIHNGHDNWSHQSSAQLRHAISTKYTQILEAIIEWQNQIPNTQEEFEKKSRLKLLLSRKSSFSMLCRSIPAVRAYVPAEFLD